MRLASLEQETVETPTPDDEALVQLACGNDLRAYEVLYRRHSARIHGLCTRLCRDRDLAEDLTQDAFVLAWRKLREFRGESSFGSWLYRIAMNLALSHLRRHRSRLVVVQEEPAAQEYRPETELKLSLDAALRMLPEGARVVFVLYSLEGMSHAEIGKELGIAVGSSKAQLHRARQLLRAHFPAERD